MITLVIRPDYANRVAVMLRAEAKMCTDDDMAAHFLRLAEQIDGQLRKTKAKR